jgi:hypothetical protein
MGTRAKQTPCILLLASKTFKLKLIICLHIWLFIFSTSLNWYTFLSNCFLLFLLLIV